MVSKGSAFGPPSRRTRWPDQGAHDGELQRAAGEAHRGGGGDRIVVQRQGVAMQRARSAMPNRNGEEEAAVFFFGELGNSGGSVFFLLLSFPPSSSFSGLGVCWCVDCHRVAARRTRVARRLGLGFL